MALYILAYKINFGDKLNTKLNHDKNICVLFGEQQVCKISNLDETNLGFNLKDRSKIHRLIGKVRGISIKDLKPAQVIVAIPFKTLKRNLPYA